VEYFGQCGRWEGRFVGINERGKYENCGQMNDK